MLYLQCHSVHTGTNVSLARHFWLYISEMLRQIRLPHIVFFLMIFGAAFVALQMLSSYGRRQSKVRKTRVIVTSAQLMHGVADNSKRYSPMSRHSSPRVKTEPYIFARGESKGQKCMRGLPMRVITALQKTIFDRCPLPHALFISLHDQLCFSRAYTILLLFIIGSIFDLDALRSSQILNY